MDFDANINNIFNDTIINKLNEISANKKGIQLTAAISSNGQREYRLWGAEGEESVFQEYLYEIGSITKTFTGILMAKAVSLRKADFDDSISLWIPEITNKTLPTIGKLVTHSAGLPSAKEDEFKSFASLGTINFLENVTRTDVIESLKKIKYSEQDYTYVYSNFGAALAGILIERIFEKSFTELAKELFLELDLKDTKVYSTDNIGLYGYDTSGKKCDNWRWNEHSAYIPAGSFVSTASDMLNYGEAILKNDKEYISLSTKPRMPISNGDMRIEIGCFWPCLPDYGILYHTGGTGCFNTALAIDTKEKYVMTILSNCFMPDYGDFILSLILSLRQ